MSDAGDDTAAEGKSKGLFDDFSGYRTASDDDYLEVLRNGVVTVDTNVLLDLYRQHKSASDQLLSALETLGDRLWVSHQALVEFHRNRVSAAGEPADDAEQAINQLNKLRTDALARFRQWVNRVGLSPERERRMASALDSGFDSLTDGMLEIAGEHDPEIAADTNTDPVLLRLDRIVTGRRGDPMTDENYKKAFDEGTRRVRDKVPPGYKDSSKEKREGPEGAAGDYLVWEQFLMEAETRGVDGLFVTRDTKEDWFWVRNGQTVGPRNELAEEYARRTGKRLFMLRAASWIHHMKPLMEAAPGTAAERDADATVVALERDTDAQTKDDPGWTHAGAQRLLDELREAYPAQYRAVQEAQRSGGTVTRERVYELANYPAGRSLRGFTRPLERITRTLQDEEVVPYYADSVLVPQYDFAATGNNQAVSFRMSPGFLQIYTELLGLSPDSREAD